MNEMSEEIVETIEKELKERKLQIQTAIKGYPNMPESLKDNWRQNLKNVEKALRWLKKRKKETDK